MITLYSVSNQNSSANTGSTILNDFRVATVSTDAPISVAPNYVKIQYNETSNLITGILFPEVFVA